LLFSGVRPFVFQKIRMVERESNVKYKEHVPHVSLQGHVKCFWIMEREYTPEHPAEDVTPDAFIELILNLGNQYVLQAEGVPDREMPRAILVGLHQKPLLFRCRGTVRIVAIRFHAWGAFPFLRKQGLPQPGTVRARGAVGQQAKPQRI
jgi:hypothetical protein